MGRRLARRSRSYHSLTPGQQQHLALPCVNCSRSACNSPCACNCRQKGKKPRAESPKDKRPRAHSIDHSDDSEADKEPPNKRIKVELSQEPEELLSLSRDRPASGVLCVPSNAEL